LTNVNVRALVDAHRTSGALVTMAVVPNVDPEKYGGVVVKRDGIVSGFATAARTRPVGDTYHFVGVQVANAEVFAHLREDVPSESVKDVYPALIAARPGGVRAFVSEAEFFDIGTPLDYLRTSLHFGSRIPDPRSRCAECILWDDVQVHESASLRRCIITDGVRIPAGSSWEHKTIRVARGELMQTEQLVGELAIGPIDGSTRV
jgi:mannose-1-phosphate guanylyltransferase